MMERIYSEHERKTIIDVLHQHTQEPHKEERPIPTHSKKGKRWDEFVLALTQEGTDEEYKGHKLLHLPTRKRILEVLYKYGGDLYIQEIAFLLNLHQSSVSLHISLLEEAGLVKKEKYEGYAHCTYPILVDPENMALVMGF